MAENRTSWWSVQPPPITATTKTHRLLFILPEWKMARRKINTNIHLDSGFGCIIMEETNEDYITNMSVFLIFSPLLCILLSLFIHSLSFKKHERSIHISLIPYTISLMYSYSLVVCIIQYILITFSTFPVPNAFLLGAPRCF